MTWRAILLRGLAEGSTFALFVGGVAALGLGMWLLGPALLGLAILSLPVVEKVRAAT